LGVSRHGERSSPLRRPPASFGSFSTWKRNSPRRAKLCSAAEAANLPRTKRKHSQNPFQSSAVQHEHRLALPADEARRLQGLKGPVEGGPAEAQPFGQVGGRGVDRGLPAGEEVPGQL